jgi:6-phosphogluconolactonase
MGASKPRLEVFADPATLARRVADWLLSSAEQKAGSFAVALSGGSTPKQLYETLAREPFLSAFPWSRAHWFFGDERFVPPEDSRSNYRMAREALLGRAPIPPGNIHPIPTEGLDPAAAASRYEQTLQAYYAADRFDAGRPLFDVTLLGLGPDGHTASLFPGTSVLGERQRWVAPVIGAKPEARITLTYPALDMSAEAAFLVTGEDKQAILRRLIAGDGELPAAHIRAQRNLWIFADRAAAGQSRATS